MSLRPKSFVALLLAPMLFTQCKHHPGSDGDADGDADTDTDADLETDGDSDADEDQEPACVLTDCGGECVDTSSDPTHCGSCDTSCPTGATCSGGECACPGELSLCGGACIDTSSDALNCGECWSICAIACVEGECLRVVDAAIGSEHLCAVRSDDQVSCWGDGHSGELGIGARIEVHVPTPASPLRHVVQVAAGESLTCAALSDGTARCWGYNHFGACGIGGTGDVTRPAPVSGLADAAQIATGMGHSCAVRHNGRLSCWGLNDSGQLGLGTWGGAADYRDTATEVPGITTARQVSLGGQHSCVLLDDGSVQCWGSNNAGEGGYGAEPWRSSPAPVPGVSRVRQISLGFVHSCALLDDGTVSCWGANSSGQLGLGTTGPTSPPTRVPGLARATQIAAGRSHTCALLEDETVSCWGSGSVGQLGDGTTESHLSPNPVPGLDGVVRIAAGGLNTCAVLRGGELMCWGQNNNGETGDGTASEPRASPTPPAWPPEPVRSFPRAPIHASASVAISPYGVAVLDDGSVLVTGAFAGEAVLGAGEPSETTLVSVGAYDLFVARYQPDGSLSWGLSVGSPEGYGNNGDHGRAISALPDGSFFVTGNILGAATFGAGEPTETTLAEPGAFLASYTDDGSLRWVRGVEAPSETTGSAVWAHPDGAVYVAGSFMGTATFAPGEPGERSLESTLGFSGEPTLDGFLARYDHEGNFIWVTQIAGDGAARPQSLSGNTGNGAVVVAGSYDCQAVFGVAPDTITVAQAACGGGYDSGFAAIYTADGTLGWAHAAGASYLDVALSGEVSPFAMPDGDQRVLVSGQRSGYLSSFRSAGSLLWTVQPESDGDLLGVRATALADGTVRVLGNLTSEATFGASEEHETRLAPALYVVEHGLEGAVFEAFPLASVTAVLNAVASSSGVETRTWITCAAGEVDGPATFFPGSDREASIEGPADSMFVACF